MLIYLVRSLQVNFSRVIVYMEAAASTHTAKTSLSTVSHGRTTLWCGFCPSQFSLQSSIINHQSSWSCDLAATLHVLHLRHRSVQSWIARTTSILEAYGYHGTPNLASKMTFSVLEGCHTLSISKTDDMVVVVVVVAIQNCTDLTSICGAKRMQEIPSSIIVSLGCLLVFEG